MQRLHVCLLLLLVVWSAAGGPCEDSQYLALQSWPRDSLSQQDYDAFKKLQKECLEYAASLVQGPPDEPVDCGENRAVAIGVFSRAKVLRQEVRSIRWSGKRRRQAMTRSSDYNLDTLVTVVGQTVDCLRESYDEQLARHLLDLAVVLSPACDGHLGYHVSALYYYRPPEFTETLTRLKPADQKSLLMSIPNDWPIGLGPEDGASLRADSIDAAMHSHYTRLSEMLDAEQ